MSLLTRFDRSDQQMAVQANTVLKVLGRSTLFILDILLRESVQNSLDAANDSPGVVTFEFDIIRHPSHEDIIHRLGFLRQGEQDPLHDRLQQRFRAGDPVLLVLSDRGTTGLSGPVRRDAPDWSSYTGRKNFENLIYQLGQNHGASKAGGSYGFGKSILYRLSPAGLVLFYTRSAEGERLVFTMVSSEENKPPTSSTGIVWWGEVYSTSNESFSAPVEDPEKIAAVLAAAGLEHKRIPEGETGTLICIVAPHLQYLLNTENDAREDFSEAEQTDVDAKIQEIQKAASQSIQRWYWPRMTLTNDVNPSGALKPLEFINLGEKVSLKNEYLAMGSLLKAAENYNNNQTSITADCVVELINHSYGNVTLGALAYQIIPQKTDAEPYNKIAMIRWPRMVVFEIPIQERNNTAVAAVFLVNSRAGVRPNSKSFGTQELDDVFRDCESATHSEWNYQDMDPAKSWYKSYVKAAREKTARAIHEALNPDVSPTAEAEFSPSAALLGQLLVSSGDGAIQTFTANGNAGTDGSNGSGDGSGSGGGRRLKPWLDIQQPVYLANGDLQFEITAHNITTGNYSITLLARGGSQSLDKRNWKRGLGKDFPFALHSVQQNAGLDIRIEDEAEAILSYTGTGYTNFPMTLIIHPVKKDALLSFRISQIND